MRSMTEYDFRDNLVTLARFHSPSEATIAQARLENAGIDVHIEGEPGGGWLSHLGPSLDSASISVRQADLRRAREVLADVLEQDHGEPDEDIDDYDVDDWAGEDWADEEEDYDEYEEEPPTISPLSRAFRAAVIGALVLPPLISFYSVALIMKHRLWEPEPGERSPNWRFYSALVFNVLAIASYYLFYSTAYRRILEL